MDIDSAVSTIAGVAAGLIDSTGLVVTGLIVVLTDLTGLDGGLAAAAAAWDWNSSVLSFFGTGCPVNSSHLRLIPCR